MNKGLLGILAAGVMMGDTLTMARDKPRKPTSRIKRSYGRRVDRQITKRRKANKVARKSRRINRNK